MGNGNHLLGASELYCTLGKSYMYYNSWSYESSDTSAQDVENTEVTVARTGTGVYTHTCPAAKKPSAVKWVGRKSSVAGRSHTFSYAASTGILTITVLAVDGDAAWAAANTDEEIIRIAALCVK